MSEPRYEEVFPYYAELCALSELRKKPGFGADLASGMGGHLLFYLNGVRVNRASGYPVLDCIPASEAPGESGAAISVNSHYRNANWVAFAGRDFVFRGDLAPGEAVTRESYARTQARARAEGLLAGIDFHPRFFKDQPAGMSVEDFKYEISVGTDYGATFGRHCYRARLPLDGARMARIVDYLNALNAPYRRGARAYEWCIFNDNCVHVAWNALAEAGVWKPWPTGQSKLRAAFGFPVPKNAVVDLARRANDLSLAAIGTDPHLRRSLLSFGALPVGPGALTSTAPAIARNEIYDVRRLRLIFYDNPFWGPYRGWFRQIMTEPRYRSLAANAAHFAPRLAQARAEAEADRGLPADLRAALLKALAAQQRALLHIGRQAEAA